MRIRWLCNQTWEGFQSGPCHCYRTRFTTVDPQKAARIVPVQFCTSFQSQYWSKPALLKSELDFQHNFCKRTQTDQNSPFISHGFFSERVSSVLKEVLLFFSCVKRQLFSPFSSQHVSFSGFYLRLCWLAGIPAIWISSHWNHTTWWRMARVSCVLYVAVTVVFSAVQHFGSQVDWIRQLLPLCL